MFKDVLNYLGDYTIYANIALLIFFIVFVAVSVRIMMKPKGEVDHMAGLPTEPDEGPTGKHPENPDEEDKNE
ncbi:hypothetical protein [Poriferisphaera sp. WC338]|uniref:hypothetical protein n=1 Tax=Poriferisphaera sp. WC338 TaxID=3425129 RepID=UPI003D81AC8F